VYDKGRMWKGWKCYLIKNQIKPIFPLPLTDLTLKDLTKAPPMLVQNPKKTTKIPIKGTFPVNSHINNVCIPYFSHAKNQI